MPISQQDIKLLWGRAASRCSWLDCRTQLTQDSEATSTSFPIGEQAYIVAKEPTGPRGESSLTLQERDSYSNLILLCPNHHTLIDKNWMDFPVEKLHAIKSNHELWVRQTLSQSWDLNQQARDLIYTSLIDSAVEYCHLYDWQKWTAGALDSPPRWAIELPEDFNKFRRKVFNTDWPGTLVELERAMQTLSILLDRGAKTFQKHCRIETYQNGNSFYEGVEFYSSAKTPERYNRLSKEFDSWLEESHQLIIDATKAVNWFREVVRRDINPMFFAAEGKFMAVSPWSSDIGLSHEYLLPEYTQQEKQNLPDSLSVTE